MVGSLYRVCNDTCIRVLVSLRYRYILPRASNHPPNTILILYSPVPYSFKTLRRSIYALCALLISMAITLSLIWLFQYRPFMANFDYNVDATTWISMDPPRYRKLPAPTISYRFLPYLLIQTVWAAMSVPIDLGIISIPYIIIKKTKLQSHERKIIFLVFAAQLLGTFARYVSTDMILPYASSHICQRLWHLRSLAQSCGRSSRYLLQRIRMGHSPRSRDLHVHTRRHISQ